MPIEGITKNKIERYQKTAQTFLLENKILYNNIRFDVICLYLNSSKNNYKIEWLKNQYFIWFFSLLEYYSMVKKARPRNPKRIRELKIKINDDKYLQKAISRIATLLSKEILGQWLIKEIRGI